MIEKKKTSEHRIGMDLDAFEEWLANRQCGVEGGFNGRTNKLCDGCYSFWIGASFPLLDMVRGGEQSRRLLFEERTLEDLTSAQNAGDTELTNMAGEEDRMDDAGDIRNAPTGDDGESLLLGILRDTAAEMCSLREEKNVSIEINDNANFQKEPLARMRLSFNARALQGWILGCCQSEKGGLRDKPGKSADFYPVSYTHLRAHET